MRAEPAATDCETAKLGGGWLTVEPEQSDVRRLVAHPDGDPPARLDLATPRPTRLAIGPEGGFSDAEVAAALAAGWQTVSLGPRIFRVETAAVALAAAISLR